LFVHVPRCAGSSVTQQNDVLARSLEGKAWYHQRMLKYYFYRAALLRKSNNPFYTSENAVAGSMIFVSLSVLAILSNLVETTTSEDGTEVVVTSPVASWLWPTSIFFLILGSIIFLYSTFIGTAMVMGRLTPARRFLIFAAGTILRGCGGDDKQAITGIGKDGFLVHFTANRLIQHKFATKEQLLGGFAIVRNPYARLVSIFAYNKFPMESFDTFVRRWHRAFEDYRGKYNYSDDCHNIYCHLLPMKAYTHIGNERLVGCIVRQEDLGEIARLYKARMEGKTTEDPAVDVLPSQPKMLEIGKSSKIVCEVLHNIPRVNGRPNETDWRHAYSQESMNLCLDMYGIDFATFGYSRTIPGRSDLVDPKSSTDDIKKYHGSDDAESTGTSTDDSNSGIKSGTITPVKADDTWSEETDEQENSLIWD